MQGMPPADEPNQVLTVRVTDADVHAARDAWWRAQNVEPDARRTAQLYESYRSIVRAQAQQIAEEFRAARAR